MTSHAPLLSGHEAQGTVTANIDTLSLALWTLDDRVLEVTARSLVRAAGIVHVEIVEDGDLVPLLQQKLPGALTNEAGPAGDQHLHCWGL